MFQGFGGRVCLTVLEIKNSPLKVWVLGIVDFDDAFVGSSYHNRLLSKWAKLLICVENYVDKVKN